VEKTTMKLSMNDSPSQPKDLGSTSKDPEQTWLKDYPAKATWSKSMKSFLKIERHPGLTKNMENLKLNAMEQQNVLDLFDVEKIKQSSSNITFLWFLGKTLKAGQQHSVKSKSTDYQYTFQGVFKNAPEQEARFLIAGTKDIEGKKLKR
ncbi:MAG: hypothetical protein NT027_03475, partial [Proteobacteria bacterium]|nr:hypothetical protein [Pseudomonadota bacterium]